MSENKKQTVIQGDILRVGTITGPRPKTVVYGDVVESLPPEEFVPGEQEMTITVERAVMVDGGVQKLFDDMANKLKEDIINSVAIPEGDLNDPKKG